MSLPPKPRFVDPRLHVRERAHKKLDELLDMYEQGEPLWIVSKFSWIDIQNKIDDEISFIIRESFPA